MKKWLLLSLILLITCSNATMAQKTSDYDVIIVRNDIPIEYIIALPYSTAYEIPIIQVSQDQLSVQEIEQLQGYYDNGARRALILGGTENAVSEFIAQTIHSMGYTVDRKWGKAREDTAATFATDFWVSSEKAVLLNGTQTTSFLMGAKIAMTLACPILLSEQDTLSIRTEDALNDLDTKTVYIINSSFSTDVLTSLTKNGISYKIVGEDVSPDDIRKKNGFNTGILYFLGGLVIGIFILWLSKSLRKGKVPEVPLFVLTEDERKVVDAIEKNDGLIHQDKLPDITNFSRPKVSRIVNDLESKKILLREKYGKTYKVKIAKKFINNE